MVFLGGNTGLRQGDPLSPLLFTIVIEFFTFLMEEKVRAREINFINDFGNELMHLIHADDIICKGDHKSALAIKDVFRTLKDLTGLDLSCEKSSLFLGEGVECATNIITTLNINQRDLPVKYLGIPLMSKNLKDRLILRGLFDEGGVIRIKEIFYKQRLSSSKKREIVSP